LAPPWLSRPGRWAAQGGPGSRKEMVDVTLKNWDSSFKDQDMCVFFTTKKCSFNHHKMGFTVNIKSSDSLAIEAGIPILIGVVQKKTWDLGIKMVTLTMKLLLF